MKFKNHIVVIIVFATIFKISAQQITSIKTKIADTTSIGKLALYDLTQSVKSVGNSFSRPFHWQKKDFTTLGIIAFSAASVYTIDDEVSGFFIKNEPHVPNLFQEAGTRFGSPQVYFISNAVIYGVGLFTKNKKLRRTSVLIISSSFTTGLIQSFTKTAIGRARPGGDHKSNSFRFWSNEANFHSLPSGHTVLSMTMAHAIAKQFNNPWSKAGVYALGSIPPISRLFTGAHWLTDVGVAAVLSIAVVDGVDKFLFKTKAYNTIKKQKTISWNFAYSGNKIGFIGTF